MQLHDLQKGFYGQYGVSVCENFILLARRASQISFSLTKNVIRIELWTRSTVESTALFFAVIIGSTCLKRKEIIWKKLYIKRDLPKKD